MENWDERTIIFGYIIHRIAASLSEERIDVILNHERLHSVRDYLSSEEQQCNEALDDYQDNFLSEESEEFLRNHRSFRGRPARFMNSLKENVTKHLIQNQVPSWVTLILLLEHVADIIITDNANLRNILQIMDWAYQILTTVPMKGYDNFMDWFRKTGGWKALVTEVKQLFLKKKKKVKPASRGSKSHAKKVEENTVPAIVYKKTTRAKPGTLSRAKKLKVQQVKKEEFLGGRRKSGCPKKQEVLVEKLVSMNRVRKRVRTFDPVKLKAALSKRATKHAAITCPSDLKAMMREEEAENQPICSSPDVEIYEDIPPQDRYEKRTTEYLPGLRTIKKPLKESTLPQVKPQQQSSATGDKATLNENKEQPLSGELEDSNETYEPQNKKSKPDNMSPAVWGFESEKDEGRSASTCSKQNTVESEGDMLINEREVETNNEAQAEIPEEESTSAVQIDLTYTCVCKKMKKTANISRTEGQCTLRNCRLRWCMFDLEKCDFTTRNLASMLKHQKAHRNSADHNICFNCCQRKNRTNEKYGQCENCKYFWCFHQDCNAEFRLKFHMLAHLKLHDSLYVQRQTITKEKPPLLSEPKGALFCSCGNEKVRPAGKLTSKCTNCNMWRCLFKNCANSYYNEELLIAHQKNHLSEADLHKCFNCGADKPRDVKNRFLKCGECHIWWCLADNCRQEFDNRDVTIIHSYHVKV